MQTSSSLGVSLVPIIGVLVHPDCFCGGFLFDFMSNRSFPLINESINCSEYYTPSLSNLLCLTPYIYCISIRLLLLINPTCHFSSTSSNLCNKNHPFTFSFPLGSRKMEAEEGSLEAHQIFFIIGATPAKFRVMIKGSSRVILWGYWFYLYKARLSVSSSLVLSTDENTIFTYDANPSNDSPALISLLLKLHTVKPFNRPSLMKTLSGIRSSQCRFSVCVSENVDGLFMVTFGCEGDKGSRLEGQPWHFAQSITIFVAPESSFPITPDNLHYVPFWLQVYDIPFMCKSHELARFIASKIGDLIEVDRDTIREGSRLYLRLRILLDKCDEILSKPLCPFTILLRGKEIIFDKSVPFQYPHRPAITLLDIPPVDLNIPAKGSLGPTIRFPSFLTNKSGIGSSSNPSTFSSYSTDSISVAHRTNLACCESMTEAFPTQINTPAPSCGGLALSSNTMELEAGALTGQSDPSVRGKGLASTAGVKRPSFQTHQAVNKEINREDKFTKTSSIIPQGFLTERSIIFKDTVVEQASPSFSF
uniref:DUF4283 domain-containing protein n=1 Tax=Cannabis sativa TaxID=3483 RepID=A0A803QGY5_CANSA